MDLMEHLANGHPLLWVVPLACGPLLAAVGSRLPRRWMSLLSLAGIVWVLLQSLAIVIFLLWGRSAQFSSRLEIEILTGHPMFSLVFQLDLHRAWAVLLMAGVALAAQLHALSAVARFPGRHRFHALVLAVLGAGGFLFTAYSPAAFLIGWEGLALAGAFLYAFWESEEMGARAGMRWLLFQRASGVLLLLGFVILDVDPTWGAILLAAAACVRAGQLPFHGWIPDSTQGTAAATVLVFGVGSTLASVFLLDQAWGLLVATGFLPEVIGVIGMAGVVLGVLAALQQQEPVKVLGWLFVLNTGLVLLGFAVGDPVASRLLVTGEILVLGGAVLAFGDSSGLASKFAEAGGTPGGLRSRAGYLVMALAWGFPPSLCFVGMARLLGSVPWGTAGLVMQIALCLAAVGAGWIFHWFGQQAAQRGESAVAHSPVSSVGRTRGWIAAIPLCMWGVSFALGVSALLLFGWVGVGGGAGAAWAGIVAGASSIGWVGRGLLTRRRGRRMAGRLTNAQRIMDRVAETGLGLGEIMVQVPVMLARALGAVLWRGVGGFVLDTLILGTMVRTVEGVGLTLRYFHNGRIQRYTLVVILSTAVLILLMLR